MKVGEIEGAEAQLIELIEAAETNGPQVLALRGVEQSVFCADYRVLEAAAPNLNDYLLGGPKVDEFEVERNRDTGRDVSL